eukprot:SAG11_NODE_1339_length_5169_cov_2.613412_3_plen_229_part_00
MSAPALQFVEPVAASSHPFDGVPRRDLTVVHTLKHIAADAELRRLTTSADPKISALAVTVWAYLSGAAMERKTSDGTKADQVPLDPTVVMAIVEMLRDAMNGEEDVSGVRRHQNEMLCALGELSVNDDWKMHLLCMGLLPLLVAVLEKIYSSEGGGKDGDQGSQGSRGQDTAPAAKDPFLFTDSLGAALATKIMFNLSLTDAGARALGKVCAFLVCVCVLGGGWMGRG